MSGFTFLGKRRSKFNVGDKLKRTSHGIVFDSKWESNVYDLLLLQVPKEHLLLQKSFELQPKFVGPNGKGVRSICYACDFVLGPDWAEGEKPTEKHVIIDCKGMITDVFKIKEKMFSYVYKLPIHKPSTNKLDHVMQLIDLYRKNWQ